MFDHLVASTPIARRSPLHLLGAVITHTVLLVGAVVATRDAAMARPGPALDPDPPALYLNRTSSPIPEARSTAAVASSHAPAIPGRTT